MSAQAVFGNLSVNANLGLQSSERCPGPAIEENRDFCRALVRTNYAAPIRKRHDYPLFTGLQKLAIADTTEAASPMR